MRKIIVIVTMMTVFENANAQTFDELFRQKKTQRKYLAQQIAALKVYLEYLKEGYKITKKGLAIVGDITDRNLSDHTEHFGSLSTINQSLGGASLEQRVFAYQKAIERRFNELVTDHQTTEALTQSELRYLNTVKSNMLNECEKSVSWLNTLSTDEKLQMRDDERLVEMTKVIDEMKTRYAFARAFANSTRLLAAQRIREQSDLDMTDKILNSN